MKANTFDCSMSARHSVRCLDNIISFKVHKNPMRKIISQRFSLDVSIKKALPISKSWPVPFALSFWACPTVSLYRIEIMAPKLLDSPAMRSLRA